MREYVLTLVVAAAVTYLTTPVLRGIALRVGALAQVRDRDVHSVPTPRLGGVAMYLGIAAAVLVASRLPTLSSVFTDQSEATAVLEAGAAICLLGVLDDRFGLDALTKLAGQVVAAGILVLQGVQLLYLPVPRFGTFVLTQEIGVIVTVLFVVVTVNAVNFVDGLDGLAAGVVGIASLAFFVYSYQLAVGNGFVRATPPTLITAVVAGACLGFLPHNFNPARVFMGDSGSMMLGLMLAAAVVTLTGQIDPSAVRGADLFPALLPLVLPLLVLAVPLIDLLFAVVRRSVRGRSPFAPDKMHLHHRLLEIGHSQTRAVLIMYFWAALLAFGAVGVTVARRQPVLAGVVLGLLALLGLVASLLPRFAPRTFGDRRK